MSRENKNTGNWYLVYTFMHDSDVRIGGYDSYNTFEYEKDKEVLLIAKTRKKAILEARARWINILAEANAKWEERKKTSTHPPKTAFDEAHLILIILTLQQ